MIVGVSFEERRGFEPIKVAAELLHSGEGADDGKVGFVVARSVGEWILGLRLGRVGRVGGCVGRHRGRRDRGSSRRVGC